MDTPALNFDDPQTQGILALAAGLMQASGPSRYPVGLGQVLGTGIQQGLGGYQAAKKAQQEQELQRLHAMVYQAQAGKANEAVQRQQQLSRIMTMPLGGATAAAGATGGQPPSPAEGFRQRGQMLLQGGFMKEGGDLIEAANKLDNNLELKDGVWYDKRTAKAVSGATGVNPQGFAYQTNLGPNGVAIGVAPGAAETYLAQQRLGEQARSERDLVTVPATDPNSPPRFASRESLLNAPPAVPGAPAPAAAPVAAGMTPAATAAQAAQAAQLADIAKNQGAIYNNLQNAAMANPGKIAQFQKIGTLLEGHEGGKLSQSGLDLASAANSAGIKIDKRLPNKEAAAALANEIALSLRSTASGGGMPGAMSDQDREFLKSMTPNLAQTNDGRKQIIDARVKMMERENQIAGMARKYRAKYKALDDGFFDQLQDWSNRNPIFK